MAWADDLCPDCKYFESRAEQALRADSPVSSLYSQLRGEPLRRSEAAVKAFALSLTLLFETELGEMVAAVDQMHN